MSDPKLYRLKEFIHSADGRSLVVDTSNGLVFGALPGLEHFAAAVTPVLPLVDGIVTSPGQARRVGTRTKHDAGLLIRADWTNALRPDDFVLPPETVAYVPLLEPVDALDLGASALVLHFLLGHEEQIEADSLYQTVQLALHGTPVGLPLIVDVQPIGPRVVLRSKAIELGVSYALEGGSDGVVIPWPGTESFKTIMTMTGSVPVWVAPATPDPALPEVTEALELGAVGIWLDERVFAGGDPVPLLESFRDRVHVPSVETA